MGVERGTEYSAIIEDAKPRASKAKILAGKTKFKILGGESGKVPKPKSHTGKYLQKSSNSTGDSFMMGY